MCNDEMAEAIAYAQEEEKVRSLRDLKDRLKCKHDWQYRQDANFDWFECSKCHMQRDKAYCP